MIRLMTLTAFVLGSTSLYAQTAVVIQAVKSENPNNSGLVRRYGLDRQDVHSIPESVAGVKGIEAAAERVVVIQRTNRQTLDTEDKAILATAISAGHRIRRNLQIVHGNVLQDEDFERATSRCLISTDLATAWFGEQLAVGKYLHIQGIAVLLVTGVFENDDQPKNLISLLDVVIPLKTYDQRFPALTVERSSGSFSAWQMQYSEFELHLADSANTKSVTDKLGFYLQHHHPGREFHIKRILLKAPRPAE